MLDAAQLAAYSEHGFTVARGLFGPQHVAAMAAEIDAFHAGEKQVGLQNHDGDPTFHQFSVLSWLAQGSAPLRAALQHPDVLAIMAQLNGPDLRWWWDQGAVKAAYHGIEFPWHQDNGYEAVDPALCTTMWVAVDATTVDNGCIWALPGSHAEGDQGHWLRPGGWHKQCYDGAETGEPVEMQPGDALIFSCQLIHRSLANTTGGKRRAYLAAYCAADVRKKGVGTTYDDNPLLLVGGRPTPEVESTWEALPAFAG